MSTIDTVLEANRRYAEGFNQGGLPGRPTRLRLAVVACMDCRLHVPKLLGLKLGDAHIIRNAGGIVTEDVLRSLIVSCHIAETREVMIINNTKCGMLTFKDEELEARLQKETGKVPVMRNPPIDRPWQLGLLLDDPRNYLVPTGGRKGRLQRQ